MLKLHGKNIGALIESDYYENELFYYRLRFAEEGADLHFLSRFWGQPKITFYGYEYLAPMECAESFENMGDAAIIVLSGVVTDVS